jgi:hypothetical protein
MEDSAGDAEEPRRFDILGALTHAWREARSWRRSNRPVHAPRRGGRGDRRWDLYALGTRCPRAWPRLSRQAGILPKRAHQSGQLFELRARSLAGPVSRGMAAARGPRLTWSDARARHEGCGQNQDQARAQSEMHGEPGSAGCPWGGRYQREPIKNCSMRVSRPQESSVQQAASRRPVLPAVPSCHRSAAPPKPGSPAWTFENRAQASGPTPGRPRRPGIAGHQPWSGSGLMRNLSVRRTLATRPCTSRRGPTRASIRRLTRPASAGSSVESISHSTIRQEWRRGARWRPTCGATSCSESGGCLPQDRGESLRKKVLARHTPSVYPKYRRSLASLVHDCLGLILEGDLALPPPRCSVEGSMRLPGFGRVVRLGLGAMASLLVCGLLAPETVRAGCTHPYPLSGTEKHAGTAHFDLLVQSGTIPASPDSPTRPIPKCSGASCSGAPILPLSPPHARPPVRADHWAFHILAPTAEASSSARALTDEVRCVPSLLRPSVFHPPR